MYNIAAVIVTHNRLALLQLTLASVKAQTIVPQQIIVINNESTDGSAEWLSGQHDITVVNQQNLGASGGFHTGVKVAAGYSPDWVWLMDDDTVCTPTTLEKLVNKIELVNEPVGFIGSKCLWTDGSPHYMNIPAIKPSFNKTIPFNKYDDHDVLLIETCSWVSLLVNMKVVKEVGLPYKEFFFWSDDCEYTRRITAPGYLGLYATDSIVVHKTVSNYCPDFYHDTVPNLWKHKYGFRNEFFLKKKYHGFAHYLMWLSVKVPYTSYRLIRSRKDNHRKFIGVLCNAAWHSLFFNPKIDKI